MRTNKIRLMYAVRTFNGRILNGIKLIIVPNKNRAARDLYKFYRQGPKDPESESTDPYDTTSSGDTKYYESGESAKNITINTRQCENQPKSTSIAGSVGTDLSLLPINVYTRARLEEKKDDKEKRKKESIL
jgi:hypothetical protein